MNGPPGASEVATPSTIVPAATVPGGSTPLAGSYSAEKYRTQRPSMKVIEGAQKRPWAPGPAVGRTSPG